MKSVFKLDKQGDIAPVGYRPGQTPNQEEGPTYYESLEVAEKHLQSKLSCDPAKALNGPFGRIYQSHMGTFALIELQLVEASDLEPKTQTEEN